MRVLLVEDEPDLARLASIALPLTDDSLEVVIYTRPEQRASLLTAEPWKDVDVAVIDLMMPETSGAEVLTYIHARFPNIRRIILTASSSLAIKYSHLAHVVLVKPVPVPELIDAIRHNHHHHHRRHDDPFDDDNLD